MNTIPDSRYDAQVASRAGLAVVAIILAKKRPIEKYKFLGYRTPAEIRREWPRGATGVGILAGPSDLVCIDCDLPDGEKSLAELMHDPSCFTGAWQQTTPSGGRHIIFSQPEDGPRIRSVNGYLPNLDIKAYPAGVFVLYGDVPKVRPPACPVRFPVRDAPEPVSRDDVNWLRVVSGGEPCSAMRATAEKWCARIEEAGRSGGVHDAARDGVRALCGDAGQGHAGLSAALVALRTAFYGATRRKAARQREFRDLVDGALRFALPKEDAEPDPCEAGAGIDMSKFRPSTRQGKPYHTGRSATERAGAQRPTERGTNKSTRKGQLDG